MSISRFPIAEWNPISPHDLQNHIPIASTSLWHFISHYPSVPDCASFLLLTSATFAHALEPLCYLAPQPGILSNSSLPTLFCYSDLGINDTSLAKRSLVAQSKIATLVPEITSSNFNYLYTVDHFFGICLFSVFLH